MGDSDNAEASGLNKAAYKSFLGQVKVAAVKVDITPQDPCPLAGYLRQGNWTSVAEPLEGNFLIFRSDHGGVLIFGSIDTLFVENEMVEAIAGRLGIEPSRIVLVASHTHNAPSLSRSTPRLGEWRPGYEMMVVERISKAVDEAIRDGGAVSEISRGAGKGNYNINRRKPSLIVDYMPMKKGRLPRVRRGIALSENSEGIVDSNIYVMSVLEGGQIKAVIWSLAAHPAFYPDPFAVSSDFPGTIRRLLRNEFGEDVAVLFLPGLAGSAIPRMPPIIPRTLKQLILRCLPFQEKMRCFSRRSYRKYCRNLAGDVINIIIKYKYSKEFIDGVCFKSTDAYIFQSDGEDVKIDISLIGFGENISILALSGEILGEWNDLIRADKNQMLTGYAGGRPIYVPTQNQLSEGGYEADRFRRHFSLSGDFLPDYQQSLVASVSTLHAS